MIARIDDLRKEKEESIDVGDYTRAERAHEDLQDAFRVKAQLTAAFVPTVDVVPLVAEVEALRAEVDRLRGSQNPP